MRTPSCCGKKMLDWVSQDGRRCFRHWQCDECGKAKPLFYWPWTWFWLTVPRSALYDGAVETKKWLGALGCGRGLVQDEITFTVIPLNVLIDKVAALWQWARYRKPNRWAKELEAAYRRGRVDGMQQTNSRWASRVDSVLQRYQTDPKFRFEPGDMVVTGDDGKVRPIANTGI